MKVELPGHPAARLFCADVIAAAVRVQDPCYAIREGWVIRRLAPDCRKVTLAEFPARRNELRMLHAMGWETGNIHLGARQAIPGIRRDLQRRPSRWLHRAAKEMVAVIVGDWKQWRNGCGRKSSSHCCCARLGLMCLSRPAKHTFLINIPLPCLAVASFRRIVLSCVLEEGPAAWTFPGKNWR